MCNKTKLLAANKKGLEDSKSLDSGLVCYYTKAMDVAYDLGCNGVDLSKIDITESYRYGGVPESGISCNYRDNSWERGLSLAISHKDNSREIGSVIFFRHRDKVAVIGWILDRSGSDGEELMLPITGYDIVD
mgnify:CR=1 FL=1